MTNSPYVGRFAPSPSGPLHLGSLVAALASYLDARAQRGAWLLRIEDLDPPREPVGAADQILTQLEQFGFEWDGPVLYQSQRLPAYAEALTTLANEGLCFRCQCTRSDLRTESEAGNGAYQGRCRQHGVSARDLQYGDKHPDGAAGAIRFRVDAPALNVIDRIQGDFFQDVGAEVGDFVVRRKDGFFAYQLAVVVDDAHQKVTDVVRGIDLLESTPRQTLLLEALGYSQPHYAHLPLVVDAAGSKLSKQSFAPALDSDQAADSLLACLGLLGQNPPTELTGAPVKTILSWGAAHWDIQAVPKLATLSA